jgi:NADH-quinone oxidoreductase subunit N
MLLGLAAGTIFGQQALIFYLFAYLFGALLVFSAMTLWETPRSQHEISEYAGLRERSPWLAGALIVGLVSLAGIPPLVGFFGKFLLLIAILRQELYALTAVMLLGVGCSLYYYLRVVRAVYFAPGDIGPHPILRADQKVILSGLMVAAIFFGLYQDPLWHQATAQWLESMF